VSRCGNLDIRSSIYKGNGIMAEIKSNKRGGNRRNKMTTHPRKTERRENAATRQAAYNKLSLDERILNALTKGNEKSREYTRLITFKEKRNV
jgi:hypothetical protein